jgi:hypothetical protein
MLTSSQSYTKRTIYLIGIVALLKIVIAPFLELGNDEVYYWTYALQPDWNHFDHPPMIGLLIRLTSLNLHWASELSLRLGSILSAALATWFVFKLGKLLDGERLGWLAALIYSASVYTGFLAGFFIMPDSPQMPLWIASLYIMAHILIHKYEQNNVWNWVLLGLMIGLAALCKVHGLFLWFGFGLFILFKRITWLLNWRFYIGVLVTLICLIPIVFWNIQYDFITYKFHSERVTHRGLQWESFARELGGEFAYQNPILFLLFAFSIIALVSKRIKFRQKRITIWLYCMCIPMLMVFWGVSLFNPTLPHWSGPAFIPFFFIAALYLQNKTFIIIPHVLKAALFLVIFILIVGVGLIQFAPRNFGSQESANYGEYCPTLDLSGWARFGKAFDLLVKDDFAKGRMKQAAPIIVDKWFPAGHLEFYVSRPYHIPLIGVGALPDLHKFAWLNKERKMLQLGDDAYCVIPSNLPTDPNLIYGKYFRTIEKAITINQVRSGSNVRYFNVYRLKNCQLIPPPILPQQ